MNKKTWLIFSGLAILISGYSIVQYLIMDAHQAGFVKLKLMFISTLNSLWYIMLFIHIVFSVIALVIGPFTLFSKYREKNINRHRILGKIYMIGILFGSVSGLYLAFFATGGLVSQFGFGFLSIFWMITAFQALLKIKHRKIYEHQKWMIRNYSLTFAAVTLRIWLVLFTVLFGFENFNLSYAIIAWLCWVPNLIVAELLIHRNRQ
ncbi:membrane protein [Lysinibacillus sphaericus]|uniref:DUF2306 domain-containing protein n=1 Tax=Lysinibacillus sphaericus TaxID=1421 RepID=UPI0018CD4F6A|nr:DUF2306 domain-containing protein [Lysinibacillus sphaericus]MBG9452549.1 membrane protein [Lysinibacillus sphaericus]MBG9477288.1 membrane protein [Lysinibacillus sphaericus]MBG9592794.1 membrane protein [Lysinibacillus sphaericus]